MQAWASVEFQGVYTDHLVLLDPDREGPSALRNQLAARTDAEWLLPLDDDDLLDSDCVETLLAASEGADVVYPWCRVEDHDPDLAPWCPNRLFTADALLTYNFIPVTALVRHELWDEVGGMPSLPHAEDWAFWKRCLAAGAVFRCVPEVLWTYRRGLAGSRNQWVAAAA